jgi:hypothetical protein
VVVERSEVGYLDDEITGDRDSELSIVKDTNQIRLYAGAPLDPDDSQVFAVLPKIPSKCRALKTLRGQGCHQDAQPSRVNVYLFSPSIPTLDIASVSKARSHLPVRDPRPWAVLKKLQVSDNFISHDCMRSDHRNHSSPCLCHAVTFHIT